MEDDANVWAPGWYDDGSGRQRWWDGEAWTHHVATPDIVTPAVGDGVEISKVSSEAVVHDYPKATFTEVARDGLSSVMPAQQHPHAAYDTAIGAQGLLGGQQIKLTEGTIRFWDDNTERVRSVVGAVAEFEIGATRTLGARTTLTRVAAGGLLAGKAGAIVGGQFQKDREDLTQVFVTISWPDGGWAQVADSAAAEAHMRKAVARINSASAYYSSINEPMPLLKSITKRMTVVIFVDRVVWGAPALGSQHQSLAVSEISAVATRSMTLAAIVGTRPTIALTSRAGATVECEVEPAKVLLVKQLLSELISGAHPDLRKREAPANAAAEATSPEKDPIVQLQALAQLRDAGILTEQEFAAKKAEILARI